MKKILLLFAFLPVLSFAQHKSVEDNINLRKALALEKTKELKRQNSKPTLFIDGNEVKYDSINNINHKEISHLSITKNDPMYPSGKIEVYMKK